MAFTNFYIISGSNDMNAGSTTAATATVTSTNGSWDITADSFIATGGTPFSATNIGDYASIYNDGVTSGAVYIGQVTAILSAGLGITLSTTIKYGTKPTASATGRSCKTDGAWASTAIVTSLFASVAVPQSTKVNIKAATYANTTTARTFGSAGLATAPLWWDGYKTNPGDQDTGETSARVDGTDIPLLSWTTASPIIGSAGNYQTFSNISFTSAKTTTATVLVNATISTKLIRCRFENTNAAAASCAVNVAGSGCILVQCFIKATTTATRAITAGVSVQMHQCVIVGGINGFDITAVVGAVIIEGCVFRANGTGAGILISSGPVAMTINRCTFKACGSDGITMSALPTTGYIGACLFDSNAGWGINNSSGANTNSITQHSNDFYNNTSGTATGFGDAPAFYQQTETLSPVVSSTDLSLVAGALALSNGSPGLFENETYTGYLDIGAVQHSSTTGGIRFAGHGGFAA
jgi:hypothetical protein